MNIVVVTEQNSSAFTPLAPDGFLLTERGRRSLGVVTDVGNKPCAVGLLTFSVREGADDEGDLNLAAIDWLYVDPRFRRQGAGALLVDELFTVLYNINAAETDAGVDGIFCDIPLGDPYDALCAFFEDLDFQSGLVDLFEGHFVLQDFTGHPKFKGQKVLSKNILPLAEIEPLLLSLYITKIEKQDGISRSISPDPDDYEKQLSFAALGKQQLDGVFLVGRAAGDGALEPLFLHGSDGKLCGDLVLASINAGAKIYPPETPVEVRCTTSSSSALLANFFPDIAPVLARRVLYDLAMEGDTL
jgi:GNAT superfamily N-acetyltransferase